MLETLFYHLFILLSIPNIQAQSTEMLS